MPAPSNRSTYSPHPSMGLPPRWNIGDIPQAYSTPVQMIAATSVNTTSAAFNPEANSVELFTAFSDVSTFCDIIVTNDDGTGTFVQVAEFLGVGLLKDSNLYIGQLDQGITLQGRAIKVTVQNFRGSGTVAVSCNRLN